MVYQDTYCWAPPLEFDLGGRPQEFVFWGFPVVQWLTFRASNAGGTGSILVEELRSLMLHRRKKKKNLHFKKFYATDTVGTGLRP